LSNKTYQILHKKKHVLDGQCSIDEHRKRLPSKFTAQITNKAKIRNWEEIARKRSAVDKMSRTKRQLSFQHMITNKEIDLKRYVTERVILIFLKICLEFNLQPNCF